ncbi:MAG TPA: PQQ-binding-like beta-propeller repeat protein [Bryobacteraceae bacterium]|jgi:outer membrane protein assembly factor BamB|nr:PQQ-binding-like beta-propeller repeat protein [Bryobacteraceae bacterium]
MRPIFLSFLLAFSAFAADWPQWRGPNRDGISAETGLLSAWPSGGPKVIWRVSGLGIGYSSFSIVNGRMYTQGQRGKQEFVLALDVKTGNKLWETPTSRDFENDRGSGPRGTPTFDNGKLYAMTGEGTVVCLDAATGKILWQMDSVKKFGASVPHWGYSESPLIDGDRVIVMPGGRGASLVSLDKRTGEVQWKTGDDYAGYSSAILADVNGSKQVIALSGRSAFGVQESTGELLWRYGKIANNVANIATPIYQDGAVFLSTAYDTGCALLKLNPKGMQEVYFNRDMMNHYSSSVLIDGTLYGFTNALLSAMDFKTGKQLWKNRSVGKGSVTYADKHLYALGEDGVVGLIDADRDGYREVSRFEYQKGSLPSWSPLVISDGRLYLRDQDNLTSYDIKGK